MNCKPGDLAVVVRSSAGNEGKIVRCIRYYGGPWSCALTGYQNYEDGWELDTPLKRLDGLTQNFTTDKNLRPIRDNDGEDETLTWKPVKETA